MSELTLLRVLLLVSLAIAPLGTHRHFALGGREHRQGMPEPSRARITAHVVALACAAIALFTPFALASLGWLLFTAGSFAVFLRSRVSSLRSPATLAACVPFLFSNIAAVWLVAGSNDLHLLGYGMHFSFYAALHCNVLGWILIGALAILADRESPQRWLYVVAIAVCFVSFLLIALGIDQLRALKPFGVIGLSIAIPIAQLVFLRSVRTSHRAAFALGCTSLAGLLLTMALAWANELSMIVPAIAGIRAMVVVHGVTNTLIVAPCFLLASVLEAQRTAPPSTTPSVRFRPSRVEGLAQVTCVVVHADRLEVESAGAWLTFPYWEMGRPQTLFGRLLHPLGVRVGRYVIGARDWFHAPRDRFFRFDASRPLTVFLPDMPDDEGRRLFIEIRECIHSSARYVTDDLG